MGHASIEEMLAEKFHVYRATLRRLNPDAAWPDPPAGTVVAVPNVKSKPLPPLSKIEIRLEQRTLRAYDTNGLLVAHFPCSIAADKAKRPAGETLRVVVWAENPEYTSIRPSSPKIPPPSPSARSCASRPAPTIPSASPGSASTAPATASTAAPPPKTSARPNRTAASA
jgi:hypothetical protein